MPKQISIRISPQDFSNEIILKKQLAQAIKVSPSEINAYQILRQSLDARNRNIFYQLQVNIFVNEPFIDAFAFEPKLQNVENAKPVLIAGAGPAGLFAALRLIESGLKPIIIERGKDVRERRRDLAAMNKEGIVNPESNYCFGEGGAGTYSDGKLYTRSTKRGNVLKSLQWFHHFGATEKILQEAHPHIGTNKLP
ncbi:MAG: FAD-dependent monooxygenase, partial [Moheibacter sp.]